MSDILENFCETENDKIPDYDIIDIEKKTDEEMSLSSLEIKKGIPIRAPSTVWQHFEKIFDNNGVYLKIKCNYCIQSYSVKCSTTTLNDHWKSKHLKIQPGGIGSIERAFNNSKQQAKSQGNEYLDHLNRLINWVILEYQPFRVVDSKSFRELINGFNPEFKVPSRQTLRNKIDNKYSYYKSGIIKIFQV